jgi:hypothetical protein
VVDDLPALHTAVKRALSARYGALSSRDNRRAFATDPNAPLLLSLENYDPETQRARKTAIFERRTLERHKVAEHVETAAEALAISLNETGRIHWPLMEKLTGHSSRLLQRELGGLVYRNPEGEWETADRYLSGDVRAKFNTAEAANLDHTATATAVRNADLALVVAPADIWEAEEARRSFVSPTREPILSLRQTREPDSLLVTNPLNVPRCGIVWLNPFRAKNGHQDGHQNERSAGPHSQAGLGVRFGVHFSTKRGRFGGFQRL